MAVLDSSQPPLTSGRILRTWWPLAASWLLMSIELPALTAVVARLPNPEINLAAYGGVVFPLSLIIESPIIMLLAASTALSRDWASFVRIRRFMMRMGALLTALHLLVALTPLYYVVVEGIIGAPPEIVEPARIGLILMTPWTWSIAYRRFHQGVLIRFDHSRVVSAGTIVRLSADGLVLLIGYLIGTIPGIVVGAAAVAMGVMSEAAYVGLRTRPVIQTELRSAPPVTPALTFREFLAFYIPLALTSLINLLAQPIGSAAISRMPLALESLAIWPVASGLGFLFRSPGVAYNEAVVALLDAPHAPAQLRRFAGRLALVTTLLLALVVTTPLAYVWLRTISALSPELTALARPSLWLLLPMPALAVLQSWYQGAILYSRRTRGITEAIVVFLVSSALVMWAGVAWGQIPGLRVGLAGLAAAMLTQTVWLWVRSRPAMRALHARAQQAPLAPAHGAESPAR
jgi:hypothetical protein